ncbi:MAG: alpha-ribazole phosphatase family protein [Gammaproteobacteria bacterium]|nr:alpha-ribazole phosphatase family protein [Pseudomonadota bacterium]QOJ20037.1 MAG: alpha-ribazole phosphatase family protein [Gammaproteobacteria bacterium]
MTTRIDLLRHGEIECGQRYCGSSNHPLTQTGWLQMWLAVENPSPCWQHIVTSPLIRCADFAHALGQRHSISVTQDDRVREIHFGAWENRSSSELLQSDADALSRFWQNPLDHPPPDGEHLLGFKARVLSAWEDIQQQFCGKRVLLITHGGVIRLLIGHILQHPLERLLEIDVRHASMRHICIEPAQSPRITHTWNLPV